MTKVRFLTLSVVALVLLNAVMVISMVWAQPTPAPDIPAPDGPNREGPRDVIIKRLQLNDAQVKEYEVLIEHHKTTIEKEDARIKKAKKELYGLLNDGDSTQKEILIEKIGGHIMVIENTHFEHFTAIRDLLREDQLHLFEDLSGELGRIFAPFPKAKGKPGPGGKGPKVPPGE